MTQQFPKIHIVLPHPRRLLYSVVSEKISTEIKSIYRMLSLLSDMGSIISQTPEVISPDCIFPVLTTVSPGSNLIEER